MLFVFVASSHVRGRILHLNVTARPTAPWTAQQLREAFPWDTAPRNLLRDRDSTYGFEVQRAAQGKALRRSSPRRTRPGRILSSSA